MTPYVGLILAVAAERLAELVVARRNLAWARRHGGREHGFGHYPFMVVLHIGLLVGCLFEATHRPFSPALGWPMLAVVLLAQALRWWCIITLGPRWNTRIIVIPGLPLVDGGPYRWLRHPNYVAVVLEGIALPLVHTAWITALVFTVLDAGLLRVRISSENAAMAQALAQSPRSNPSPSPPAKAPAP
ncbi:MAG: isoprenylcysteine carboxyl methyltransferase family protein [Actinomycetota bacterium]